MASIVDGAADASNVPMRTTITTRHLSRISHRYQYISCHQSSLDEYQLTTAMLTCRYWSLGEMGWGDKQWRDNPERSSAWLAGSRQIDKQLGWGFPGLCCHLFTSQRPKDLLKVLNCHTPWLHRSHYDRRSLVRQLLFTKLIMRSLVVKNRCAEIMSWHTSLYNSHHSHTSQSHITVSHRSLTSNDRSRLQPRRWTHKGSSPPSAKRHLTTKPRQLPLPTQPPRPCTGAN